MHFSYSVNFNAYYKYWREVMQLAEMSTDQVWIGVDQD